MKRMYNVLTVTALVAGLNGSVSLQARSQSDFNSLSNFFREFDELVDRSADAYDAIEIQDDMFAKDVSDIFIKMQQEARRLHQQATEGMRALQIGSLQGMSEALKRTYEDMKAGSKTVDTLVAKIGDSVERSKQFDQFSIKELENKDQTKWGVRINLPGFVQEDLTVNISKEEGRGGSRNMLEVIATHKKLVKQDEEKEAADQEEKSKKDSKEKTTKVFSQHMYSSTFVNGRQREIDYKNGVLKIKMDLPQALDIEDYTMSFDEKTGQLILEFVKKEDAPQKKSLTFTNLK